MAAQRASVTRALGRLRARGLVTPRAEGGWLLASEGLGVLPDLAHRSTGAPSRPGVLERLHVDPPTTPE